MISRIRYRILSSVKWARHIHAENTSRGSVNGRPRGVAATPAAKDSKFHHSPLHRIDRFPVTRKAETINALPIENCEQNVLTLDVRAYVEEVPHVLLLYLYARLVETSLKLKISSLAARSRVIGYARVW